MTDLQGIVAAAIHLHDEERDLRRWEFELAVVEAGLASLDLSSVASMCRRLAAVQAESGMAFQASCAVHAQIRERAGRTVLIDGASDMLREQAAEAESLGDRHLSIRTRMRALDSELGSAIAALRDEDLEQRLQRLVGGEVRDWSVDELTDMVREDHRAISDAFGSWRLMHSPAILQIAGSNTRRDVVDALTRMRSDGRARRDHSFTRGPRWTFAGTLAKAA